MILGVPYRKWPQAVAKCSVRSRSNALFEQRNVELVGSFPELEDQLCAMTGAGYAGDCSPDRADAIVWAFTELMLSQHTGRIFVEEFLIGAVPGAEHLHPRWISKDSRGVRMTNAQRAL